MQCDGSVSDEARANPMNPSAAKRAGAFWCWTTSLCGARWQTVREPSPI